MRIDCPTREQLPQLRQLWQEAFGDEDTFLDSFFGQVFAPDRCRCITDAGQITAVLYWLDCRLDEAPLAYLYAVATRKTHRGKGLCRSLMADTHRLLKELGYAGTLLVPGEPGLFQMYQTMGYDVCSRVTQWRCRAAERGMALREIDPAEYAALRRQYLPAGGVVQEGENLTLLTAMTRLYAGENVVFCARKEQGQLICPELLGDTDAAGRILASLQCDQGLFRGPGQDQAFAMYHPFDHRLAPQYFGLAFD